MTKLLRLAAVALIATSAVLESFPMSGTALDQRKLNDQPQFEGGDLRVLKRTTKSTTTKPKTTTTKSTTKPKTTTKSTKTTKSSKTKVKVKVNVKDKNKNNYSTTTYRSTNKSSGGSVGGLIVFLLIVLIIVGLIVWCQCFRGKTTVVQETVVVHEGEAPTPSHKTKRVRRR